MKTNAIPPVNPNVKMDPPKKHTVAESNKPSESVVLELGKEKSKKAATYSVDAQTIAKLKSDFTQNTESFKAMVRKMLEKQGLAVNDVLKALDRGDSVDFFVDEETRASAEEAISENGFWGVEQTATRILDFAKALSGGDPSKIDMLVSAFKEGFEAAKEAFGGKLPDISQKTYDRVMEGFENWRKESK